MLDLAELLAWFEQLTEGVSINKDYQQAINADLDMSEMRNARAVKNGLKALEPVIHDARFDGTPGIETVRRWDASRSSLP